jgi:Icc-related predicted phosphoesterase
METLIIKPKDKAELNFFLDLAKRLGTTAKTYEEMQDEQLLKVMEQNMKTPKTNKKKVLDTLQNILNDGQAPYNT